MASVAGIEVRLIRDASQIPLSAQQWNELLGRNETNTIFQTFEWFEAWWRTFGDAHRLFFLLVSRGGHILGFAPFMLTRGTLGRPRLEFAGTGNADYQDLVLPIDKREAVAAICAFLRARCADWHRAWLCNIPSHSSTLRLLEEEGRRQGLYLVEEALVPCPVLRLDGQREAAGRLIEKYSMRRPLNWFSRRGEVIFRHVATLTEIEALLPVFFDQHVRRWRAAGVRSPLRQAKQQEFYLALARAAHSTGWLQFSVVEVAGEPIAFHFGFDYRGSVIWYKPSFEVGYAAHSPGLLLIRQLIADALSRGRGELDFTIGGELFKERFANEHRSTTYVGVYHNRAAYIVSLAEKKLRRLAGTALRRMRKTATGRQAGATAPL